MKKQNKDRNKKNKLILIIGVLIGALILASIIFQAINIKSTAGSNSDASGNWQEAFTSKDLQLIYLGRPTCSWCNKLRPYLNYMNEKYDAKFVYINMDNISQSDQTTIFNKLEIDASSFGTPYLAVIKDGKKLTEQVGFVPEDQLFKYLQTNGIISKSSKFKASGITEGDETTTPTADDSTYKNLNFINFSQYKAIYDGTGENILILGQTGCGYCNKYKPVVDAIAKEKDIKINYLDMLKLSEEEWNTLMSDLNDYFETLPKKEGVPQWGTPLTLILKDKKVVDALPGYTDKTSTLQFYTKNKLIK